MKGPLGPLTCHDSTIVSAAYGFIAATAQDQSFTGLFPWRWQDSSWRLSDPGDLRPSQEITKDVSPTIHKGRVSISEEYLRPTSSRMVLISCYHRLAIN